MVLKFNLKKFLISMAIPLAVGGLSAFITRGNTEIYSQINKPILSPPGWLFPVMWSLLYILMGISLYIVANSNAENSQKRRAFIFFATQLLLNFIWSPVFFGMQQFLLAFILLIFMFIFTVGMVISFYGISKTAGLLQIPYILWLAFAGYLNLAIYLLN